MQIDGNRVPRAVIPTLAEMSLALEARLASLWQRDAGHVRDLFADFEVFRRWYLERNWQK